MCKKMKWINVALLMCKGSLSIIIPMISYLKFNSINLSILSSVIWRVSSYCSNYYKFKRKIACPICVVSLGLCFILNNPFLFFISLSVSLIFFFGYHPFSIDKYSRNINKFFYLFGIMIGGPILLLGNYIFFYLIVILILSCLKNEVLDLTKIHKQNTGKKDIPSLSSIGQSIIYIGAFCHNAHYYAYSIIIPVFLYCKGVSVTVIGICFSFGWIYYLFKEQITEKFIVLMNPTIIIIMGFLVNAIMLFAMAYGNTIIFLLAWLITGITAGISENFWCYKNISAYKLRNIWEIGGICGTFIALIISILTNSIIIIFIISALLCFIGATSFVVVLWKNIN